MKSALNYTKGQLNANNRFGDYLESSVKVWKMMICKCPVTRFVFVEYYARLNEESINTLHVWLNPKRDLIKKYCNNVCMPRL